MTKDNVTTSQNADVQNNSNYSDKGQIIEHYGIFKIVDGEQGFFIALGRHRVSGIYKNKEEVINLLNRFKPEEWEFLSTVILTFIDEVNHFNENLKSNNHE